MNGQALNHDSETGPLYKLGYDPRVTRVGKIIRKTSLDELPQFFNVLWHFVYSALDSAEVFRENGRDYT